MKTFTKVMLMIVAVLMVATGCQKVDDGIDVTLKSSGVNQLTVTNWKSGNAAFECTAAGGDCSYAFKIDEWNEKFGMDGAYETLEGNSIVILNSNGKTFDWSSEYPVCKIIVKAGRGAIIYSYPEGGVNGDSGLLGFQGKGISHVTFCYAEPPELIIAVKARYDRYINETTSTEDNCESAGLVAFTTGWCSVLGYNSYPSTLSFDMVRQGTVVGSVVVNEVGEVTVTLEEGKTLTTAWLFIGTLEELQTTNLDNGCPAFTNPAVWIPNSNPQTDGDGLSYMFFDL